MEKKEKIYLMYDGEKFVGIKYNNELYRTGKFKPFKMIKKEVPDFATVFSKARKENNVAVAHKGDKNHEVDFAVLENIKVSKKVPLIKGTAIVLAGAIALGVGTVACKKLSNKNSKDKTVTTLVNSDSVEDLLKTLEDEKQKEAYTKIDWTQNYFNNISAPSISIKEDNGAQLYLEASETEALYAFANSEDERLSHAFVIDSEKLYDDYTKAAKVLTTYYLYGTERSGISRLFESEKEKEFFEQFEDLVIGFNKGQVSRSTIEKTLEDIFYSGKMDEDKDKYPGASSFIATFMTPALYVNHGVGDKVYKNVTKINQTLTCNDIKSSIKSWESNSVLNIKNTDVIEKIRVALDRENIKVSSRDINISARSKKAFSNSSYGTGNKKPSKPSKSPAKTTTSRTVIGSGEEGRQEAVSEFGKEEVSKAEEEAVSEFHSEYDDENERAEVKASGYQAGYNAVYEAMMESLYSGQGGLSNDQVASKVAAIVNNYTGKYKDEYKAGATSGAAVAVENAKAQYAADAAKIEEAGRVRVKGEN